MKPELKFNPPTPEQIAAAAETMWGAPLDETTANSLGLTEKCTTAMRQFLEQYPVTAAMTFAMTFGYQLRQVVEQQQRKVQIVEGVIQ